MPYQLSYEVQLITDRKRKSCNDQNQIIHVSNGVMQTTDGSIVPTEVGASQPLENIC
jgi:hypothetical protein